MLKKLCFVQMMDEKMDGRDEIEFN